MDDLKTQLQMLIDDFGSDDTSQRLETLIATLEELTLTLQDPQQLVRRAVSAKRFLTSQELGAGKYELELLLRQVNSNS